MNVQQHAALLRQNADALAPRLLSEKNDPLQQTQCLLCALADQVEQDTLDPFLRKVTSARAVELLVTRTVLPDPGLEYADFACLAKAGLDAPSFPFAKAALLALWPERLGMPLVLPVGVSAML